MELKQSEPFLKALAGVYRKGEKTLLAFSGGADSTALFYLFLAYQKNDPEFYFEAFHLNHRLRGRESDEDAEAVMKACSQYQIKLHLETEEVEIYAKMPGFLWRRPEGQSAMGIASGSYRKESLQASLPPIMVPIRLKLF
jgi:tRNA(Ile)-lysidine synthase TilS/MesJ